MKCCIKIPNDTFLALAIALEKNKAHTEREKKVSDPGGIRTHDLWNRLPLFYQLSYKTKWELVVGNIAGNFRQMN